jgi:uncharacterized protein GlcG (DUF336 family)
LSLAKLARASAVHVGFAFVAMGGWALFANRTHGAAAIAPALAQGTLSGAITFGLKRVLEALAARLGGPAAYVAPPLITATVILAVLVGVHLAIHTPEIAATIAVPWSVSTLYAFIYTAVLVRERRGRHR